MAAKPLYRVVDENPFFGAEDLYERRTLDTAATLAEEITGVDAAQIETDLAETTPWKWTDEETGREVTIRLEVE